MPPLPKPAVIRDREPQVQERIQVIREELAHYVQRSAAAPQIVTVVAREAPEPDTVWEEIGEAIGDGVAAVRGFAHEMASLWRGCCNQIEMSVAAQS